MLPPASVVAVPAVLDVVAELAEVAKTAVVAVAALPLMLPVMVFVTVRLVNVPTLVKLEFNMFGGKVVPVSALAGVGVEYSVG